MPEAPITDNPILNSPYEEPEVHYATDPEDSTLNYEDIRKGRRVFQPGAGSVPEKQKQSSAFDVNHFEHEYGLHLVNLVRKEVSSWRQAAEPNVTRVTKDLLFYWFLNDERLVTQNPFFVQREAIENDIWLNEVARKRSSGKIWI